MSTDNNLVSEVGHEHALQADPQLFGLVSAGKVGLGLTSATSSASSSSSSSAPKGEGAKANAQKRVKMMDPNFGSYPIQDILDRNSA